MRFLNVKDSDFNETLHDTIRLAYVGLFHKFENYREEVLKIPELLFGNLYHTKGTVESWADEKFKFKLRDVERFHTLHKINWICNCVKHRDGLPTSPPKNHQATKPAGFEFLPETQRLIISPDEFKKDAEWLVNFYPHYLQLVQIFALHKLMSERITFEQKGLSQESIKELTEKKEKLEKQISSLLSNQKINEDINKMEISIEALKSFAINKSKEKGAFS